MKIRMPAIGKTLFSFRSWPIMALVVFAAAMTGHAHGISEADQQAMVDGGNLRYLWLGAVHMLTGYDHLLFLFGVIFYLTSLKDVFKFVTIFTIGHSITLIAATYLGITANYYLVDAVIALSVCYKAFDNLDGFKRLMGFNPPNLLGVILVFGLIHGFGLSTRLQQLPLPDHGLIWRILSFNVGVEFGQVAALAVLVLLLAGLRKTAAFKTWGTIVNGLLFLAGVGLFFFQMTGYFLGHHDHHDDHETPTQQSAPHHHDGQPVRMDIDILPKSDSASSTEPDSASDSPAAPHQHESKATGGHSHSKPHSHRHEGKGTHTH